MSGSGADPVPSIKFPPTIAFINNPYGMEQVVLSLPHPPVGGARYISEIPRVNEVKVFSLSFAWLI
jgi:hypothetical protein